MEHTYGLTIRQGSGTYFAHHGVKGQKWGVRRYQNEDGSLTNEGKKRYGVDDSRGGGVARYPVTTQKSGSTTTSSGSTKGPNWVDRVQRGRIETARQRLGYQSERIDYNKQKLAYKRKKNNYERSEKIKNTMTKIAKIGLILGAVKVAKDVRSGDFQKNVKHGANWTKRFFGGGRRRFRMKR